MPYYFTARFDIIPVEDSEIAKYGSVQAGLNQIIRKVGICYVFCLFLSF